VQQTGDLYSYKVSQFQPVTEPGMFLEFTVVLILLIELFYLFKGKSL